MRMKEFTKDKVNTGQSGNNYDDDVQCIDLSSDDDSELVQEILGELNDNGDEQISKELDEIRTDLCNKTGVKKDEDPSTQNKSTNESQQKPTYKNKTGRHIEENDKKCSSISSKYTHTDASSANNFAANSGNNDETVIDFFDKDLMDEFAMETSVEENTLDKIPKTVNKKHTTSSSRNVKIATKPTRVNDENSHTDKIGKKSFAKITLDGLGYVTGKKENLTKKRTREEKPSTKTKNNTVELPLKESNFIEVAGEDIKAGIFTRVIIIGEYFISNYRTVWPKNCEIKPYLLYKRNVCIDSLYSQICDHRFMKNSQKILVMFVLGFHDVAKYSDVKAHHCNAKHRKFRFLQDLFYHQSDSSKYVSSMVALKNKIEADTAFSAIFCYLPYINFYEGIARVYSSCQKYASSCPCFHEMKKLKQDSLLRSFRTHADTNMKLVWKINREIFYRNLNETKEGIFEFLPFDVLFNDSWFSVETSRSSQIINNSKQLSMMISKYIFGKGEKIEYELTLSQKSFMESKLEGMTPVRILIIGDTWMKGLAEKWSSKDQIQPFFYCKDDMTLNDITKIIFSLSYIEELLVITAVPSGELFSTTQYSHCKNHTPLQYPVLQRDLLENPRVFADDISKKIGLLQLNVKRHYKKCHVVFLTCYPAVFSTCYKQLFEQHIASSYSHNRNDDPFKTISSSFLDNKIETCLKQLNIYIENLNNLKNCKSFDVFSLVSRSRLSFPKLFVFPSDYQNNHSSEMIEKLFDYVYKYIYSVYELMASEKLKLPLGKIAAAFKGYRKNEDEERPESNGSFKKQNSLTECLYIHQSNTNSQYADVKNFGSEAANFSNVNNHNQKEAPCPGISQESLVAYPQHFYESSVSYSGQQQQQNSYQQEPSYINQMSQENIAVYPQAFYNTGVTPISGQQYFQQTPAYANSFTYANTSSTTFIPSNSQMESYANISTYGDQGSSTFIPASTTFTNNNQKSITEQLREELCGTTNGDAHTEMKDEVTMQLSQGLSCNTEKLDPSIFHRERKQSKERSKIKSRDEKLSKSRSKERRRSRSRSRSKGRRHSKSRSRSKGRRRSKSRSRRKEKRRSKSRSKDRRRGKRSRSKERRRHKSKDESKSKRHSSKQDNHISKRSKHSSAKDAILKDCASGKERTAIARLWDTHIKECEMYSENPETHPDHDRMKQMFMHVIRSQGLMSPEASNDHWRECWKKKMITLLKESWEEKKKKCLSDLSSKSHRKALSRSRSSSTSSSSSSSTSSSSSSSSSSYSDSERRKKRGHKNRKENLRTKAKYKSKPVLDKETALKNISPPIEKIISLDSTFTAENFTSKRANLLQASVSHPVLSEESKSVSSLEEGSELLLTTFSILCQLSERLGALGISLKHMYGKALELSQKGINPYDCIDEDSEMLLSLIHTKLKENLKDPNLSFIQKSIIQEAECRLKAVITYIETKKSSSHTVDIETLAKLTFGMQVADIIEFIRTELKNIGRDNISNDELMKIYLQVKSEQVQLVTKRASNIK